MEEEKVTDELPKKIIKKVEEKIKSLLDADMDKTNVDQIYKLVDIHKDIKNEEYWKVKEEYYMNYGNYGGYGNYSEGSYGRRGVAGTGRGRYRAGGNYSAGDNYSARGYDAKYRGEDMIEEMHDSYNDYMESGSYGGPETMEALQYMLKSAEDFFKHIKKEAKSQEEIEMVRKTAKRISEM